MGQATYSPVGVTFETEEKAIEAEKIFKDFNKIAQEKYNGDAYISDLRREGDYVSFELSSGRTPNCEWQVQLAIKLLGEIGGIVEFNADIMILSDGYYFCADEGDFKEHFENTYGMKEFEESLKKEEK